MAFSCSEGQKGPVPCFNIYDCRAGEICYEGWCTDPATVDAQPAENDIILDVYEQDDTDCCAGEDTETPQPEIVDEIRDDEDCCAFDDLDDDTETEETDSLLPDSDEPESPCGNGMLDEGEECDDGNKEDHDACRNTCTFNRCGDGARLIVPGAVLILPSNEGSGATAYDVSGEGNQGAINGAAWGEGRFGNGLTFSGAETVTVPEHPSLKLTTFTVAAWVKISVMPSGYVGILQKDGVNVRNYGLFIAGADNTGNEGKVLLSLTSAVPEDWRGVFSSYSVVDGRWHHVLGTYDGSVARLYVDGLFQSEAVLDIVPADTDNGLTIGLAFPGQIDEVRIYRRELTQPEIVELATSRLRFHFDEPSGNTVFDASGNNLHGSLAGVERDSGVYGGALFFNGAAGQVTVPHSEWLDLGPRMVLKLWLKTTVTPANWVRILGKSDTSCANRNYGLWIEPGTGKVLFQIEAAEWLHLLSDIPVTDGAWHRIEATYNGATARILIDGAVHAEQDYAQIPVLSNGPLTIGGGCASSPVEGLIDEVAVYGRALSPENVGLLPLYREELCDDGNIFDGDGCSAFCVTETIP